MRTLEVVVGVILGFTISAFGAVIASGIAWLIFDPLSGPFNVIGVK